MAKFMTKEEAEIIARDLIGKNITKKIFTLK